MEKTDKMIPESEAIYQTGLRPDKEDVISAHFMHKINQNDELSLYNNEEFSSNSISISSKLLVNTLLPTLQEISNKFIS